MIPGIHRVCAALTGVLAGAALVAAPALPVLAQATTNPSLPRTIKDVPKRGLDPDAPTSAGWWNDAVFYQVFVRSFQDSGSGPLAADGIGDFQGLTDRLDYLNDGNPETTTDLGVTGLWLMPMMPSPSYHGYDITDYRGVHPDYGTKADFRRFLLEAHKRGIRVILDLVLNHSSNKHPWFIESVDPASPKHDWYIWADAAPGYKGPWGQTVWHPASSGVPGAKSTQVFYGLFWSGMPDLNYRNPKVTAEMFDVVRYWLDLGVDGYRLDAIRHLIEDGEKQDNTPETHEWLKGFSRFYKSVRPDALTVGEVWAESPVAASYVGGQLDIVFEFDLAEGIIKAGQSGDAAPLKKAARTVLELYPPNQFATFLSNHDQTRVMTRLKGDSAAMRLAAVTLLTGPGVPFIYYGEELGAQGDKPDPELRLPMPWTGTLPGVGFTTSEKPWKPAGADVASANVESQDADAGSMLNLYRTLIRQRLASPALRTGRTALLESSEPGVFAMLRWIDAPGPPGSPRDAAVVVVNFGKEPVKDLALAGTSRLLDGAWTLDKLVPLVGSAERGGAGVTLASLGAQSAGLLLLKPLDGAQRETPAR